MSAQAYTEDQLVEQPAIGFLTELQSIVTHFMLAYIHEIGIFT